jgi:hypothetical protein
MSGLHFPHCGVSRQKKRPADLFGLVLTRYEAARMCTISVQTFDVWVKKKILPGPIPGTRRWSRISIEWALTHETVSTPAELRPSAFEEWKRHNAH